MFKFIFNKFCFEVYIHIKMPGGKTCCNPDWLSLNTGMMFLFHFGAERKTLSPAGIY